MLILLLATMDVAAALRSLDLTREDDVPDLSWLIASHTEPALFWADLVEHVRRTAPVPKSRPGAAYDLFQDAVGRHASTARTAFIAFEPRAGWISLSYAELGARAAVCADGWARAGLVPGAVVTIALPLGVPWLIAFAAALRLGLVPSFLEPAGDRALVPRLDALAPARVIIDPAGPPPLGPWAEKALSVVSQGPPHAAVPHAYAPQEPCALVLSPVRAPLLKPSPLAAEIAWRHALRDAVFAYRLAPGDVLALPGFPLQQTHPAAMLAVMLAGATFVHVSMADLAARPALLREQPITTLGVSPALRDVLRQSPIGKLAALGQWIKSVDEPLEWAAWKDFVDKQQLTKTMSANVLVDAAAGGAVLFSTRRPGSVNAYALPAAGRPYALFDAASGEPATGGAGVFVPKPGDPKKDGWFLLARRGAEYLWGSTLAPRRAGRVFPAGEVEAFVSTLPGVLGAATVPVPTGDPGGRWAFVLVAFVGAGKVEGGTIDAAIRARLSGDHVPDRVTVVPLHPRKKDGKVDVEWCRRQYSSGFLRGKAVHPVFRDLAALRGLLLGA